MAPRQIIVLDYDKRIWFAVGKMSHTTSALISVLINKARKKTDAIDSLSRAGYNVIEAWQLTGGKNQ